MPSAPLRHAQYPNAHSIFNWATCRSQEMVVDLPESGQPHTDVSFRAQGMPLIGVILTPAVTLGAVICVSLKMRLP